MILTENKFLLFSCPERNFPNTTLRGFLQLMSVIKMQKSEFEGVPWMLDCSFWTIKMQFSQEFGEYRISAFCVL